MVKAIFVLWYESRGVDTPSNINKELFSVKASCFCKKIPKSSFSAKTTTAATAVTTKRRKTF